MAKEISRPFNAYFFGHVLCPSLSRVAVLNDSLRKESLSRDSSHLNVFTGLDRRDSFAHVELGCTVLLVLVDYGKSSV